MPSGQLNTATPIITGPSRRHQVRRHEILSRVWFRPDEVQVDTASRLMFGPNCARTSGGQVSPYDNHCTGTGSPVPESIGVLCQKWTLDRYQARGHRNGQALRARSG